MKKIFSTSLVILTVFLLGWAFGAFNKTQKKSPNKTELLKLKYFALEFLKCNDCGAVKKQGQEVRFYRSEKEMAANVNVIKSGRIEGEHDFISATKEKGVVAFVLQGAVDDVFGLVFVSKGNVPLPNDLEIRNLYGIAGQPEWYFYDSMPLYQ